MKMTCISSCIDRHTGSDAYTSVRQAIVSMDPHSTVRSAVARHLGMGMPPIQTLTNRHDISAFISIFAKMLGRHIDQGGEVR